MFRHTLASFSNLYKLSWIPINSMSQPLFKNSLLPLPGGHIFAANMASSIVNYNDVLNATNNNGVYIIDVREPSELKKTGYIPNSVNIPLAQVENVLKNMSPEDFLRTFGRPKPESTSKLIFSCQAGRRAATASDTATKLGFRNIQVYQGSWGDWEKNTKQKK